MIVSMMMMMTFETTHFTKGKSDSKCGNILTPYFTEYTLSIKKCSHCLETLLPTMHFMIITIAVARHYNNGRRRQSLEDNQDIAGTPYSNDLRVRTDNIDLRPCLVVDVLRRSTFVLESNFYKNMNK